MVFSEMGISIVKYVYFKHFFNFYQVSFGTGLLNALYRGFDYIKKHYKVQKIKDRFANPSQVGYRDIQLVIELEPGVPAEIQLHVPEILQAKTAQRTIHLIQQKQKKLYQKAWQAYKTRLG